jgi:hypothetical protein
MEGDVDATVAAGADECAFIGGWREV